MLGDNVLLLGIIISILFFVLGIRSFKNDEDWFEGTFYFLISAMSTCLMSVMLLTRGAGYITPNGCAAIALVGLTIGWTASCRMCWRFPDEHIMSYIVHYTFCLLFFAVYFIISRGELLVFEGILENSIVGYVDLTSTCASILILIHCTFLAISSLYGLLSEKHKQSISTKIRSVLKLKKKERKEEINT